MPSIIRIIRLILVASTLCLLAGCGEKEAARVDTAIQEANRERARAEQEQQARKAAEKQRQDAEAQREAAEKARQVAEQSKTNWMIIAGVVAIVAIVLLIFGAALGSSARKDTKTRGPPNE